MIVPEVPLLEATLVNESYPIRSRIVSVLCFLGAGAGGYALYLDLHDRGPLGQGLVLGRLSQKEESVRRKPSQSLLWSNAEEGDPFYFKDSVRTGPESTALVELSSGSKLEIGENSLVVMDELSELPLRFIQGSGVLYQKDQRTERLLPSQAAEPLSVSLQMPEPLAVRLVGGEKTREVRFGWKWRKDSRDLKRQANLILKKVGGERLTLPVQAEEISLSLKEGVYDWSLEGLSQKRRLRVVRVEPPVLVYPNPERQLTEEDLKKKQGSFRWIFRQRSLPKQIVATLEVSSHPHFETLTDQRAVTPEQEMAQVAFSEQAILYWRIRLSMPGFEITSQPASFVASLRQPLATASPVLSPTPSPSAVVPSVTPSLIDIGAVTDLKPAPNFVFKEVQQNAALNWKKQDLQTAYEVVLYEKKQKWEKRLHKRVLNNRLDLKTLKPGRYSWTIRALGEKEAKGPFSPLREFRVIFDDPLSAPEVTTPEVQ